MSKPKTANEIKKAALTHISKYGYEGTSLNDIAKTVGIKPPSIYSHFESKEQLFLSVIEDLKISERETFFKLIMSLRKKPIEELFHSVFFFYTDTRNIVSWQAILKQILMNQPLSLLDRLREEFKQLEEEISIHLTEFFKLGKEDGWIKHDNPEPMISLFFTLIDGLLVEQSLYDNEMYENRREQIWNMYKKMITHEPIN